VGREKEESKIENKKQKQKPKSDSQIRFLDAWTLPLGLGHLGFATCYLYSKWKEIIGGDFADTWKEGVTVSLL
jgi:hypothetical protein